MPKPESPDNRPDKGISSQVPSLADALAGLLPKGFSLVATPEQLALERGEVYRDRQATFSALSDRVKALAKRRGPVSDELEESLLSASREGAIAVPNLDPFEEYRRSQDLHTKRETLMNLLYGELSVENGLKALNATEVRLGRAASHSMQEVVARYPNLTKTEVLLFGLCEQVPTMFVTGTRPKLELQSVDGRATEVPVNQPIVPSIFGASINGLLAMPDTVNPNDTHMEDIYSYMGITGANETIVTSPYKPEVKKVIAELIPLLVTNFRLHERLWTSERVDSALADGFGKVDRLALERALGTIASPMPLSEIIQQLPAAERSRFDAVKLGLEDIIGKSTIADLHNNTVLDLRDTVKLLGLLERIPGVLLDTAEPFTGYFIVYGPGLLFLDEEGHSKEYVPYNPYYLREVLQGLYTEQVDISKDNATMAYLFNALADQAVGITMAEAEDTGEDPSPLEGIRIDLKLQYNMDAVVNPHLALRIAQDWGDISSRNPKKVAVEPHYKFGLQELQQLQGLLKLLPRDMVMGVKQLRKDNYSTEFPIQAMLTGLMVLGKFYEATGALLVVQHEDMSFLQFSQEARELRAFTIIHELGHNVWRKLTPAQQEAWANINWLPEGSIKMQGNLEDNFLTSYSHQKNAVEDFCEHFAAYVLHADEFRGRNTRGAVLQDKYRQLKTLFSQFAGEEKEYPQIATRTLEQITGYVNQEVQRLDLEAAWKEQASQEEAAREVAHRRMGDKIIWTDHTPGESDPILGRELEANLRGNKGGKAHASEVISSIRDILSGTARERSSKKS